MFGFYFCCHNNNLSMTDTNPEVLQCVCQSSHHGLQFISGEEREERNRHHPSHTFSHCSHLLIKLMQPETHHKSAENIKNT